MIVLKFEILTVPIFSIRFDNKDDTLKDDVKRLREDVDEIEVEMADVRSEIEYIKQETEK